MRTRVLEVECRRWVPAKEDECGFVGEVECEVEPVEDRVTWPCPDCSQMHVDEEA